MAHANHQKQWILVCQYFICIAHIAWALKVLDVLQQLSSNEGEQASKRCLISWRYAVSSPLHALHFLPTGTSKQDLSGMKSVWHRNVLEWSSKVCLQILQTPHLNRIIPIYWIFPHHFLKPPKESQSSWTLFDCCMLPSYSRQTSLIVSQKMCREQTKIWSISELTEKLHFCVTVAWSFQTFHHSMRWPGSMPCLSSP